jgi:hypothetical protein
MIWLEDVMEIDSQPKNVNGYKIIDGFFMFFLIAVAFWFGFKFGILKFFQLSKSSHDSFGILFIALPWGVLGGTISIPLVLAFNYFFKKIGFILLRKIFKCNENSLVCNFVCNINCFVLSLSLLGVVFVFIEYFFK